MVPWLLVVIVLQIALKLFLLDRWLSLASKYRRDMTYAADVLQSTKLIMVGQHELIGDMLEEIARLKGAQTNIAQKYVN